MHNVTNNKLPRPVGFALLIILTTFVQSCMLIDPLPPIESSPEPSPGVSEQGNLPPVIDRSESPDYDIDDSKNERVAIATPESVARTPHRGTLSATARLRQQASSASAAGDYTQAIRLLERALRISAGEAQTYHDIARIRLQQDRRTEALQMAKKGLSLRPELSLRNDLEQLVQLSSQ